MTGAVVILSVAYAAVAALLLSLNLATPYAAWIKALAVALVTGLYGAAWAGWNGVLGWATPAALPDAFRVMWITVDDPDKVTREPGFIYFWVRSLDDAGLPSGPPRAHRAPWTEASAEAAQQALKAITEGSLMNGRLNRSPVGRQADVPQGTEYAGDPSLIGEGSGQPRLEFERVPPPALPPKPVSPQ